MVDPQDGVFHLPRIGTSFANHTGSFLLEALNKLAILDQFVRFLNEVFYSDQQGCPAVTHFGRP